MGHSDPARKRRKQSKKNPARRIEKGRPLLGGYHLRRIVNDLLGGGGALRNMIDLHAGVRSERKPHERDAITTLEGNPDRNIRADQFNLGEIQNPKRRRNALEDENLPLSPLLRVTGGRPPAVLE